MTDNPEQADWPSAPMIGWGMALIAFGGIAFVVALRHFDSGEPAFWLVASGLLAAAGWISLGVGVTRLAGRVDAMYGVREGTKTTAG